MNYYYITGASRGIGKALAEILLQDPNSFVYGLSRTNSIQHPRFKHLPVDLSNIKEVQAFEFPDHSETTSVSLVNNSGMLGEVNPLGKLQPEDIIRTMDVNITSPMILINSFMKKHQNEFVQKNILNVSSGAARHPFESWSVYCASKASLDMMSRVIAAEQKLVKSETAFHVFSVAPGIVDTQMQTDIRKVTKEQFPRLDTFVGYHENKQLSSPYDVAARLADILTNPAKYNEVILDVRNI